MNLTASHGATITQTAKETSNNYQNFKFCFEHFNSFSCCKSLLVTADNYYDHNTEIIHIQFWFQFQLFLLRFSQFSLIHVFLLLSAPEPNAFKILLVQFYLTVQNQQAYNNIIKRKLSIIKLQKQKLRMHTIINLKWKICMTQERDLRS